MSDEDLQRGVATLKQQIEERERAAGAQQVAEKTTRPKLDRAARFRVVGERRVAAALWRLKMIERLGGPGYARTQAQTDYILAKLREAIARIEQAFAPRRGAKLEIKFPE